MTTLAFLAGIVAQGALLVLVVALVLGASRMITGPGHADRFVALDMLAGVAVAMAALSAAVTMRREFLDVAFGIALISFVGTCALARLLEREEEDR